MTTFDETAWLHAERPRLVRLCGTISGDRDAAEDLAQETLLEAWRSRHKLHDVSGADRWLTAIARNVCLRFARRRGRDAEVVAEADVGALTMDDRDADLGYGELEELLDRALSSLPPVTRDVLVRHYVEGLPQAEIAARRGMSEAAVSMRISRGRAHLRHLLADEAPDELRDGWQDTRVWCSTCGSHRLQMLRDEKILAFRCTGCGPTPSTAYDLSNPSFTGLDGNLVRPAAILKRAAAWSYRYFRPGTHEAACTRCGRAVAVRGSVVGGRRGLHGACRRCGEEVWSSVPGLAHVQPEARAFCIEHARIRTAPERELEYRGSDATLVRLEAVRGVAALDLVFARHTLRLLAVH